jgi:hypothetical protein
MLSLYLMVTTALFTVRMEPAWQSAGGRTVVVLILLMVVPCILATTGVLQGQAAVIVYPITLLLAVAISLVVLVRSARSKNASFESVKPAKVRGLYYELYYSSTSYTTSYTKTWSYTMTYTKTYTLPGKVDRPGPVERAVLP